MWVKRGWLWEDLRLEWIFLKIRQFGRGFLDTGIFNAIFDLILEFCIDYKEFGFEQILLGISQNRVLGQRFKIPLFKTQEVKYIKFN